ncbi:hypothetical protein TNCV_1637381 [Trichonephila clavipes]|nr:hypothetical protein TNCV_1637381 [Trichonephila clavipes]
MVLKTTIIGEEVRPVSCSGNFPSKRTTVTVFSENRQSDIGISKSPTNADAFSALEIAMEWYEQQSESCPTQLRLLKRDSETLQRKREDVQQYIDK